MAEAKSNKVLVQNNKYCWMICEYTMSGTTMNYSLSFKFEGGCAQLDNAWIKVGNTTVWDDPGRVHNYEGNPSQSGHTVDIHSGSATIDGTKTVTFGITKYNGVAMSGSFSVTGGTAPSGGSITNIIPEWDRITATVEITNWGGYGSGNMELKILKEPYSSGVPARQIRWNNVSAARTGTVTNSSTTISDPTWVIQGCSFYHTGIWATNDSEEWYRYQGPTTYTPPAPSQFSYTDLGGVGAKTYSISFTGVPANNDPTYTRADLTRSIRYKIDSGNWIYVDNATVATLDFITAFNVVVPAGSVATIEGWQTYKGLRSVVSTVTLTNTNAPVGYYGSVNNVSKKIVKYYGPVNNASKKIIKFYGSAGGVSKKVYEDV